MINMTGLSNICYFITLKKKLISYIDFHFFNVVKLVNKLAPLLILYSPHYDKREEFNEKICHTFGEYA